MPELTADEAAAVLCRAVADRPRLISPWWSRAAGALHAVADGVADGVLTGLLRRGVRL